MEDPPPRRLRDTTLYRIAPDVGFNARVEPFWYTYRRMESRMGFFERRRDRRRLARLAGGINRGLRAEGVEPQGWDDRPGKCVGNLRVARLGLVLELKNFLREAVDSEAARGWTHLDALRDRACYLIPPTFERPLGVSPGRGEDTVPVLSAPRLRQELAAVNERLRIDETFQIRKMVEFLDATEKDIAMYESRYGTSCGFWAKFAYVLVKKLADMTIDHGFPTIIA